jgi:predicted metal-dependent phosphotriesterase family hydrolase
MNLEQMKRAAAMGAYLEVVSGFTRLPEMIEDRTTKMREIGPEHFVLTSDRGQGRGPEGHEGEMLTHLEGLVLAAEVLREHGFTERELDVMLKENPAKVLGLPLLD